MPDDMLALPAPPFDINKSRGDGLPIARLPTLGASMGGPFARAFGDVSDVESYVARLNAATGNLKVAAEGTLVEAAKALGIAPPMAMPFARMAFMPDPSASGLMAWPGIQPESLDKVARENILPQLIIRNRAADLRRYSGLSSRLWEPGWNIGMRDPKTAPTAADTKDIREAELFIANCSRDVFRDDPRERDAHRISAFSSFLSGMASDTLTFDGWALWTQMDNARRVRAYCNLPAGLIRLVAPGYGYKGDDRYFAALVDATGNPAAAFTRDELVWSVRNVRNNPEIGGYGWSEIEQAIRVVQGYQGAIDLNVDTFQKSCYASDTEVLTNTGWKTFGEVNIETDTFATLNLDSGAMEYQKATARVWDDYEGDMYWMKSRSVDLFVTPNHRVITQYRPEYLVKGTAPYVVYRADDLYGKLQVMQPNSRINYCLPMMSEWKGKLIEDKKFAINPSQYKDKERTISGDDYCAFMGMYLSEGNVAKNSGERHSYVNTKSMIWIHQREYSKAFKPFKALIAQMLGKEPCYNKCGWFQFGWKGLAAHVATFGSSCYDKRIPDEIMNATPRQQKIFWDYYVLGDGCIRESMSANSKRPTVVEHIATTSKRMADQLQELAQKMGYAASIHTVRPSNPHAAINGVGVKSRAVRYDINLKTSPMQSMDIEKGTYKGKIGCVSVPNGSLYVRRGGKAMWCGNSIPNGILKLKGDFWQQEQIDALTREMTNMKRGVSKLWGVPVISVPEDGDIELMEFMDMKGKDVWYREHMNMMVGVYCIMALYPIRRLGLFASGAHRDNQPVTNESVETAGVDDPGLPMLLGFIEGVLNQYLLWTNWPRLIFRFMGKNPKQDAREYEARKLARTYGEARAEADLSPLTKMKTPDWIDPVMELMEHSPDDPAKQSMYQAFGLEALKAKLGTATGGGTEDGTIGAPFPSKRDPAKSQEHGHRAGVRRDGAAERRSAESNKVNA